MKKLLSAMLAIAGGTMLAGKGTQAAERTVTVCMAERPDEITEHAQLLVSKIFRHIGVMVDWHNDARFCRAHPDQAIVISYSRNTPKEFHPGALAIALPYEGTRIELFYDRIMNAEAAGADFLAEVLAHEITHILQNIARHSKTGLMKAVWDKGELVQMKDHRYLGFTNTDVDLIYTGMAARQAAGGARTVANRVE